MCWKPTIYIRIQPNCTTKIYIYDKLIFTFGSYKECINFLDVNIHLCNGLWWQTYISNRQTTISIWIIRVFFLNILNILLFMVSSWELERYVHLKVTFWSTALQRDFLKEAIQKTWSMKRWVKLNFLKKVVNSLRFLKESRLWLHTIFLRAALAA